MTAAAPPNEPERLAAVRALGILDTPPEPAFDDLVRLAAHICVTPIALVSLSDENRQWFKARFGLDAEQIPRAGSLCSHATDGTDLFVVPDASADERFAGNGIVTGPPHVRFYAGVPLLTPDGHALGTLCVLDRVPRTLTGAQADALRTLARQVVAQLLLRQQLRFAAHELQRHETFRVLFEQSSDAHLIFDEEDGIIDCNHAAVEMLHCRDKSEVLALHPAVLSPEFQPDGRRSLEKCIEMDATARRDGFHRFDWTHRRAGGDDFPCEVTLTPAELHGRTVLLVVWHDLTERKRVEDALLASEAKFRLVVDRLAEGLFVVDPATGRFVEANAALLAMLGYTATEFAALSLADIVADDAPDAVARSVARVNEALARDGRCDLGRKQYRRKDGGVVPVEVRVSLVPAGDAGLHAVIVRDMTEQVANEERLFEYQAILEEANAKLRALAATDGLTGVRNRGAFNDRLTEEYHRAARFDRPLSLLLLDVDHFKQFNDTFGHPAGDDVLKTVARTLATTARITDFVARYGGEEFAVILPDTDYAGAMVLAERCRQAIAAAPWKLRSVTVSIGAATRTADVRDAAELVVQADEALYASKAAGRNRVQHRSGAIPFAAAARPVPGGAAAHSPAG